MAQRMTYAVVQARAQTMLAPTVDQMQRQVMNYLKTTGIKMA
jgi:hypothetical protein